MSRKFEEIDMKTQNLVAKHARKYNVAVVMVDRKKAAKRGKRKHKTQWV